MSIPESFKLNTGAAIPAIGLGTWKAAPGQVRDAVSYALKNGYKHIDGALCYQVCFSPSTSICVDSAAELIFCLRMKMKLV